jgi:hypothetical protein
MPYLKKKRKIRWDGNGGDVKVILKKKQEGREIFLGDW